MTDPFAAWGGKHGSLSVDTGEEWGRFERN